MTRTPSTDEWGIDATWLDALDEEHQVAEATIERLREVIGIAPADLEDRAPIVARPGDVLEVELRFPDSAAGWIAGFGPDVVVLEPEVLAKAVREKLLGALRGAGVRA